MAYDKPQHPLKGKPHVYTPEELKEIEKLGKEIASYTGEDLPDVDETFGKFGKPK